MMLGVVVSHPSKTAKGWGSLIVVIQRVGHPAARPLRIGEHPVPAHNRHGTARLIAQGIGELRGRVDIEKRWASSSQGQPP
jgi:hypothetical protein